MKWSSSLLSSPTHISCTNVLQTTQGLKTFYCLYCIKISTSILLIHLDWKDLKINGKMFSGICSTKLGTLRHLWAKNFKKSSNQNFSVVSCSNQWYHKYSFNRMQVFLHLPLQKKKVQSYLLQHRKHLGTIKNIKKVE